VVEPARGTGIEQVLVVVPARDEERVISACLASLRAAVDRLTQPVTVVVTADRCTDGTAALAREAGVHVVGIDAGSVGAARRAGVAEGMRLLGAAAARRTWLASTDADTVVPRTWLVRHLALAAQGARLVLGRAVPDPGGLDAATVARWHHLHPVVADDPHRYVHGANLGVRLDAYVAAGGWPALREHEDHALVAALAALGTPARLGPDVITSARREGRTPGGYAGYLRALLEEPGLSATRSA
jgi:glycosyltransferase involved in cell wall biosynthesis